MKTLLTLLFCLTSICLFAQDDAKYHDMRKLLDLTGAVKIGIQTIEVQKKSNPNIPQEFWVEFKKQMSEEEFSKIIIPIYDKHFTHQDIKDLIFFYQRPWVGKQQQHCHSYLRNQWQQEKNWAERLGKI